MPLRSAWNDPEGEDCSPLLSVDEGYYQDDGFGSNTAVGRAFNYEVER